MNYLPLSTGDEMTGYEKQSLAMLIVIARGIELQLLKAENGDQPLGTALSTWQGILRQTISEINKANHPAPPATSPPPVGDKSTVPSVKGSSGS